MIKNNFTLNHLSEEKNPENPLIKKPKRKGNYILGETIGEGAFAKVKLGKHIYTGEKVAVKILNKNKLFQDIEENKSNDSANFMNDIKKIRKEINILKRLKHRNIIQLYEIMESKTNLYLIMEYCEGKDLFDYIVKKKYLSEKEACIFFQQIIDGVEYLHLSKITHRDLKPENLLLDKNNRICISDFGLSTISDEIDSLLETPCGTPSYAPPEMLLGEKYNGVESDIWSCGIILYSMLVGNLPFMESEEDLIYKNIMKHNYYFPDYLSTEVIDLIENMLKINPEERYGFDDIKNHEWFNIIQPKLKPGIIFGVHKIPIDTKILEKVEKYGYDKIKCYESVYNNNYDSYSAIYYLLLKKNIDENKSSISDLYSDEYIKFIKDSNNWILPEKINDPIYKDYEINSYKNDSNSINLFSTIRVNTINNINRNNFEAIPEEYNKESESLNDSLFSLNKENKDIKNLNNNLYTGNLNKIRIIESDELEKEKRRVNLLIKMNKIKNKKINKENIIINIKNDIKNRKIINSSHKDEKSNSQKNKVFHKKIFNDIIRSLKNNNMTLNLNTENNNNPHFKSTIKKAETNINNSRKRKLKKLFKNKIKTPNKQLNLLILDKKVSFDRNKKNKKNNMKFNNDIILQKFDNKTISNNLNINKMILNSNNTSKSNLYLNNNNASLTLTSTKTEKKMKNRISSKSNNKKFSSYKNDININRKYIKNIQISPKQISKFKHNIISNFKSREINKKYLNKFSESQPNMSSIGSGIFTKVKDKKAYKSCNYLISSENIVDIKRTISKSFKKKIKDKKIYNNIISIKRNINNNINIDENILESLNDTIDNKKKLELLQKLEKDEIKFQNDINIIDNITMNSTSYTVKEQKEKIINCNILNQFAEKMIKSSMFNKYLIDKNKIKNNEIKKEGEIETNFYKLQKYKNIIGIIEHLKNKKFEKKLIDFNIDTFDEYLNDEDDKIFTKSLLNIKGVESFINKIKISLNKKEKLINSLRTKSYEQKEYNFNKELKENNITYQKSTNNFYYGIKNIKSFGYQNTKNKYYELNNKNSKYNNNTSIFSKTNKNLSQNSSKKKKSLIQKISSHKKNEKNKYDKKQNNIKINKFNDISENEESSSNYNSNNISIEKDKNNNEKENKKYNEENDNIKTNKEIGIKNIIFSSEKYDINENNNNLSKNRTQKDLIIESELRKNTINDKYTNKNGEIVIKPHLSLKKDMLNKRKQSNNYPQNIIFFENNSNKLNFDAFCTRNKNYDKNNYSYNNDIDNSKYELNSNSFNNMSNKTKKNEIPICNTYTNGFFNIKDKKLPIISEIESYNKKINKKNQNIVNVKIFIDDKIKKNIDKKNSKFNNKILNSKNIYPNSKINTKNNIMSKDLLSKKINDKSIDKKRSNNLPNSSFYNTFFINEHNEESLTKEKHETEHNAILNKNINCNTMNYFYKKNNSNLIELKNIQEFTPFDLSCILYTGTNDIINKTKYYLKKKVFLCIDKDNGIRAIKGNTTIEIKLYKLIKDDDNNVYFNIKMKSNDLKKDKELMRKLIKYIHFKKN